MARQLTDRKSSNTVSQALFFSFVCVNHIEKAESEISSSQNATKYYYATKYFINNILVACYNAVQLS